MKKKQDVGPQGLPPPKPKAKKQEMPAMEKARICPTCGQPGRVASNSLGVRVYCGPCKTSWPVSLPRHVHDEQPTAPRGLSKRTLLEPDLTTVFDD